MSTLDHRTYEKALWDFWEKEGFFQAKADPSKTPYTVLIPPPNVTAQLHMGHGLNNTLQDVLIRWKRMEGYNACWLPGTDHAGIATQMMVEKSLEQEGLTKVSLGREGFLERCRKWKETYGGQIVHQLKRLGASCDWSREAYTMDDRLSLAVRRMFVDLYEKGLIYRGERLVHWDPVLKTALSDDEIENEDQNANLYHIRYHGSGFSLVVATTRPETLFGDQAVAVHPEDERYRDWIGQTVALPFMDRQIPVIADARVKMDFGTGCLKITPAHDPTDFEIGQSHGLTPFNILEADGTLNTLCPPGFSGLDRFKAREEVVKALKASGDLIKIEPIRHSVPISERSKAVIEPRLSLQWYVSMKELAEPALQAAQDGSLEFFPQAWKKTYIHWLSHIQDWCISRQLWWGHRIPLWECQDCHGMTTGMEDPHACSHCQGKNLVQDPDVLDTWFSSQLWPISPFGWPEKTEDLSYFFPSAVLITGADIIYLWVARMVIASCWVMGKVPFRHVYFNPIICDKKGRKFSKTLGNGIDPLEMIDLYGADAVRYTCLSLAPLSGRVLMEKDDFGVGHRFIHKIWNAAQFLKTRLPQDVGDFKEEELDLPSRWLLTEFRERVVETKKSFELYRLNDAVEGLHQFVWRLFCDWALETAKENPTAHTWSVLLYVFEGWLRLAAPVIPFVTEEIWGQLPAHPRWTRAKSLVISSYPDPALIPAFEDDRQAWGTVQDVISGIRSLRMTAQVPLKDKVLPWIWAQDRVRPWIETSKPWILRLSQSSDLVFGGDSKPPQSLMIPGKGWSLFLPVGEYMDLGKEKQRLTQEITRVDRIVSGLRGKLSNQAFVDRAPQEVVTETKGQLANMESQLVQLRESLEALG